MVARMRHLVNDEAISGDSGTYRLRLPDRGKLHALFIKVHCTNGATACRNVTILDVVDEFRVLSEKQNPLFLLSSQDVEKYNNAWLKSAIPMVWSEAAGEVQEGVFTLLFGRKVYDKEMYLPLERHNAVDLEIDYSPPISATVGFATGTITIDVVALITPHEETLPYLGTIVTRRFNRFTSLASGDTLIGMPDKSKARLVAVSAYEAGVADGTDITRVIVRSAATGNPLADFDWDDLIAFNRAVYGGLLAHCAKLLMVDNDTLNTRICEITNWLLSIDEATEYAADTGILASIDAIAGDLVTLSLSTIDIVAGSEELATRATATDLRGRFEGQYPSAFGMIPLGFDDSPDGYCDIEAEGGVDVVLTNGGAGADVEVSFQEVLVF